jgi:hypothetical protein
MASESRVLELLIRTKAELSGLIQARSAVETLGKDSGGLLAPIPKELLGGAESAKKFSTEMIFAGGSVSKARAEVTTLVRELATGGNTTRTLGALIGALNPVVAAVGVGVFVVVEHFIHAYQEIQKINSELAKGIPLLRNWSDAIVASALNARSQADAVKVGLSGIKEILEAETKVEELRKRVAAITNLPENEKQLQLAEAQLHAAESQAQARRDILASAVKTAEIRAIENENLIKATNLDESREIVLKRINDISQQEANLDVRKSGTDAKRKAELDSQMEAQTKLLGEIIKEGDRRSEALQKTHDQIALNNAEGNEELSIQMRVAQAYQDKLKALRDAHVPEQQAVSEAQAYAESVRNAAEIKAGAGSEVSTQQQLTVLMREQAALLQNIRQQQELINQNPFLSADAKQAALLASYTQEMRQLSVMIIATKAAIQNSALDPAQLEQLRGKVQQLTFEYQLLGLKVVGIAQPLKAELAGWVTGFGTAAHQIGQTITGTINAALQGTNQLLLDGRPGRR